MTSHQSQQCAWDRLPNGEFILSMLCPQGTTSHRSFSSLPAFLWIQDWSSLSGWVLHSSNTCSPLTSDNRFCSSDWPLCADWRAFVVALSVPGYLGQTSSHAETKPGSFWISLHVQDLGCQPPQGLHKSRVNDRAASSKLVPRVTDLQHPVLTS